MLFSDWRCRTILNSYKVASAILLNLNLNSHVCLVATVLDSTILDILGFRIQYHITYHMYCTNVKIALLCEFYINILFRSFCQKINRKQENKRKLECGWSGAREKRRRKEKRGEWASPGLRVVVFLWLQCA